MYETEHDEQTVSVPAYLPPRIKPRASVLALKPTEPMHVKPTRRGKPPLVHLLSGMCFILACFLLWTFLIVPTATNLSDQWHYGDRLISTTSQDVGHGGLSEFIAYTDTQKLFVLEIVGKRINVLSGSITLSGSHLVRLSFQDVNHDGRLDLIVTIDNSPGSMVLFNTGTSFSWVPPA